MKIYIAGPDVFRPYAETWAEETRQLCVEFGHEALIPLDGTETTAAGIYEANIRLIQSADAVIANLNPFRGCEPDSGTAFEVGYATALGKPVVGYLDNDDTTLQRAVAYFGGSLGRANGRPVDPDGWFIEDFGLPLNLMLSVPCRLVVGGLKSALRCLK